MTRIWYTRLAHLGRWPRRLAAMLCLLLAAASALSAQHPTSNASAEPANHASASVISQLPPGLLAVPVTLSDDAAAAYLHSGDRIELYAAPESHSGVSPPAALLGTGLLVISVLEPPADTQVRDGTHVLVAAERTVAARIAAIGGRSILAVVDK